MNGNRQWRGVAGRFRRSLDAQDVSDRTRAVNDGDLSHAEAMLIKSVNQAHALEAMFD